MCVPACNYLSLGALVVLPDCVHVCVWAEKHVSGLKQAFHKSSLSTLLTNHVLRKPHTHTHTALAANSMSLGHLPSTNEDFQQLLCFLLPPWCYQSNTTLSLFPSLSLSAIHTHRWGRRGEQSMISTRNQQRKKHKSRTNKREGKTERRRAMTRGMDSQYWCYQRTLRGGEHRQRGRQTEMDRDSG